MPTSTSRRRMLQPVTPSRASSLHDKATGCGGCHVYTSRFMSPTVVRMFVYWSLIVSKRYRTVVAASCLTFPLSDKRLPHDEDSARWQATFRSIWNSHARENGMERVRCMVHLNCSTICGALRAWCVASQNKIFFLKQELYEKWRRQRYHDPALLDACVLKLITRVF